MGRKGEGIPFPSVQLAKNGAPCRMKAFMPWCSGEVGPTRVRDT